MANNVKDKNNQTNLKNAIVDLAKGIGNVFKKYSRATRKRAWERLTSKEGEKEVDKILLDPNRQINTFQKLANKNESFSKWMELRESKKDACYHKVKSRYEVWPSAYASGALEQCRKKGAKNWGNKKKKKRDK